MNGQASIVVLLYFLIMIGAIAIVFTIMTYPMGIAKETVNTLKTDVQDAAIQQQMTETIDSIYNFWLLMPFAFLSAMVIWMFAWSQRKDQYPQYN